ncbi:hypothetical protein RFI_16029, partial [Reticulomyxa filosa]
MLLHAEEDTEKNEEKLEILLEGCHNKEWVSFTTSKEELKKLTCLICHQIAENAIELHCKEHEETEQLLIFGEQCLKKYLEENNGKCPVNQHCDCQYFKNKMLRLQISELVVVCPLQYELTVGNLSKQEKEEHNHTSKEGCETDVIVLNDSSCNYKGKIADIKNHLKSCKLALKQNTKKQFDLMTQQITLLNQQLKQNEERCERLQSELQVEKNQTTLCL